MKNLLTGIVFLTLSTTVIARGGNDNDSDSTQFARGTTAWFAAETAEHGAEGLVANNLLEESAAKSLEVNLTSAKDSNLVVDTDVDSIIERCLMQDHYSRGGTVLKKEVYCDHAPMHAPRTRLTRGSNLWVLTESLEHSLSLLTRSISSTQLLVKSAKVYLENSFAKVSISTINGQNYNFQCTKFSRLSQSNTVTKIDVNCVQL